MATFKTLEFAGWSGCLNNKDNCSPGRTHKMNQETLHGNDSSGRDDVGVIVKWGYRCLAKRRAKGHQL